MSAFLSQEAESFSRIASRLADRKVGLAELAEFAHLSMEETRQLFDFISETCGAPVVEIVSHDQGEWVGLTSVGHALLDRLNACSNPLSEFAHPTKFRLILSQTMITSGLLDGMLKSLRDFEDVSFEIFTNPQRHFAEIADDLATGDASCAVVWGTPQRLATIPDGLHVEEVVTNVDVVIVAHEKRIIDQINPLAHWLNSSYVNPNSESSDALAKAMSELDAYRCAALPIESQPANDLLPKPIAGKAQRTEVDSIDSALALVRCGAADFAVMPAIYDRLEREQQDGNIVFSEPIARIPIVVVSRKTPDSRERSTLHRLLAELRLGDSMSMWRSRKTPSDKFPRSFGFYTKLRYGYFIGADVSAPEAPLEWCWQSMKLFADAKRRRRTLQGTIINQFGNQFEISSAQFRDTFLLARVKPVGRGRKMLKEFFSRFHYCDFRAGIICGTWSGSAREDRSGVFATVWSHSKLDLAELSRLTRIADLQSVMSARTGCEDKEAQEDLTGDAVVPISNDDSLHRLSDLVDDEDDF